MDSEVDANLKTLVLPASTTISTFGATLVDDASASDGRTTLGFTSPILDKASPGVIGNTSAAAGTFTTLTATGAFTSLGIDDNASTTQLTLTDSMATFTESLTVPTGKYLVLGSGSNFALTHDGANTTIINNTGNLSFSENVNSGSIYFSSYDSGGTGRVGISVGGTTPKVDLYYNGASTLTTSSTGVDLQAGYKLTADRTTEDAAFINFKATVDADATSAISSLTTSGAVTHHIQVEINGTTAWIPCSTTDPS